MVQIVCWLYVSVCVCVHIFILAAPSFAQITFLFFVVPVLDFLSTIAVIISGSELLPLEGKKNVPFHLGPVAHVHVSSNNIAQCFPGAVYSKICENWIKMRMIFKKNIKH